MAKAQYIFISKIIILVTALICISFIFPNNALDVYNGKQKKDSSQFIRLEAINVINNYIDADTLESYYQNPYYLREVSFNYQLAKNQKEETIARISKYIPLENAKQLVDNLYDESRDTIKWLPNEIHNSIILPREKHIWFDSLAKEHKIKLTDKADCICFEAIHDSTNIKEGLNDYQELYIDTLDYYYDILLLPDCFWSVKFFSFPVFDTTHDHAVFVKGIKINKGLLKTSTVLCKKVNNTWVELAVISSGHCHPYHFY